MAPVLGRPFIEWVIRLLAQEGIQEYLLSTGFLAETVEAHFEKEPVPGARISCCPETTPLGTAGGFLNCVESSSEPVSSEDLWLVTNGDSMAVTRIREFLDVMNRPEVDAAVLGLRMEDASRYGTLAIAKDGRLLEFTEKKPGSGIINAGVYLFRHRLLKAFPKTRPLSFETEVFPELLKTAQISAWTVDAPFLDIGTPQTFAEAEAFLSQNRSFFEHDLSSL
jgi:D-glycero-alpha-D-manno-heptose 1-phosphate guanylyltransferase